jgi:hypothetical protein
MEALSLTASCSKKGGKLCSARDVEKEEDGSLLEVDTFYFVRIAEASGILIIFRAK